MWLNVPPGVSLSQFLETGLTDQSIRLVRLMLYFGVWYDLATYVITSQSLIY